MYTAQNLQQKGGSSAYRKLWWVQRGWQKVNCCFQRCRALNVSHAPCGLFVYFQRTVGGKESVFKPGQDEKILLSLNQLERQGKKKCMPKKEWKQKIHSSNEFSKKSVISFSFYICVLMQQIHSAFKKKVIFCLGMMIINIKNT